MRIDRWVAQATDLSRKAVQLAIKQGRIQVDEKAINSPAFPVRANDKVTLDGHLLKAPGARYFMLHKPAGYLCATTDAHHPTVLDLLDEANKHGLQIVGRLDIDTTGLLLITDDGQWNHRVTSPRRACEKTYLAGLAEPLASEAPALFAEGILLRNEQHPTRPAQVQSLPDNYCRITITEGRYHQVKRMLGAVNNRVVSLHRERIGEILLDPTLTPGQYRPLTAAEIASVQ
ncbi:16S rRNA pseudouridine(516) synthase RsuA [Simiduia agarivorans]|uniref:Pseudouridine synthase n=1 Tax=Simiduia agarivorans (strain DSM 21679 / JCM 13881 / BCRC 17597 / SA1) TaxID=1117647 RepID=K4KED3_SIMAS|nr:16S rRNA pseudouridine(516) synthase RsuA [Simiduia agarivorans]AFU97409.1 16S rRNA pseudouridylate synthase A [Simiduia agarivorans SA1 = DSM 21679]